MSNGIISGRLFWDSNADHSEHTASGGQEAGIGGQQVQLLNSSGNVVATVTSASDGSYSFGSLSEGQYYVRVPSDVDGQELVDKDAVDYRYDSDANANGKSDVIYVSDRSSTSEVDFGYVAEENDADGVVDGQDSGEVMDVGYADEQGDLITETADVIDGNGGDDTISAGGGDDTVTGGSGDDSIEGEAGNDSLVGDGDSGSSTPTREVFEWDRAPDPSGDGSGVDTGDNLESGFSLDTGNVTVTYSSDDTSGQISTTFISDSQNVSDVATGGGAADDNSGLGSVLNGSGNSTEHALDFSDPVSEVSFRINDIDGDGQVSVTAYDADGNPVTVNLTAGGNLTMSDTDSVAGDDTATSQGGYVDPTSNSHSVLVDIPGPVSRIVVDHVQVGTSNSGIIITDVYYDVTPDDGGDAGDDTLIGGSGDDTLIAGDGNDSADGGDDDDVIDTSGSAPAVDRGFAGYDDTNPAIPQVDPDEDPYDDRDTVDGGSGNDTITTGDDADLIRGGTGEDVIDAGIDDDTVDGGDDADVIVGGEGSDSIDGGEGADTIYGGLDESYPDSLNITDDGSDGRDPDPDPTNGMDTIDGGAGNDVIYGQDDDDVIYGGTGSDTVDAGIDDDLVYGGDGSDSLVGGSGDDTIYGDGGTSTGSPVTITITEAESAQNHAVFAYTIDDDGNITATYPLSDGALDDIGSSYTIDVAPGETVGIGFTTPGGETFYTSGYGANSDLNPDGNDPTTLIAQDGANGPVTIGFEDWTDDDYNDVQVQVDLGTSGATFDTQHAGYSSQAPIDANAGIGDDTIEAGDGDDEVYGGSGDDLITGGAGADSLSGGADRDTFIGADAGDTIDGGSDGDDYDTLDLTGIEFEYANRTLDDDGNSYSGTINLLDDDGNVTGSFEFRDIEEVIPCFTPGTKIATAMGERLVEDLKVGDRIITRDNGIQEIRWIGQRALGGDELLSHLQPILIRQGALGNGLPERDMMVSPNHRVLVANDKTALYFEDREVLVAAKHLTGLDGIDAVVTASVTYIHFMFEQHEVVLSDGAWTESFQPGDQTLRGLDASQRNEIYELFPELRSSQGRAEYSAARRALKKHEAQLLVH